MAYSTIRELPSEVKEVITEERFIEIDERIYDDFGLNSEQIAYYGKVFLDIVLQRKPASEFLNSISRIPNAGSIDVRKLALRIILDRLWPISFHLKGLDKLIIRLGGKLPEKPARPKVKHATDDDKNDWMHGSAKDILSSHVKMDEMYITQKPIKNVDDRLKSPSVTNWLDDYLHTMGAEGASNLKRSQYLAKSRNVSKLNEEEKMNLLNFLVSYEESMPMYWRLAEEHFLLVQPELPKDTEKEESGEKAQAVLSELVDFYKNTQDNYFKIFNGNKGGLELEISDNIKKLYDIIWDSLGLSEIDRCLSAICLLIHRHGFEDMMQTDHRFKGIVSRAIEAQYGVDAKRFWTGDMTTAVSLTIFWQLTLVEKLGIEEHKATIIADMYRKAMKQKVSPMYLDLKSGKFLFRGVQYDNRKLQFV